MVPIWQLKCVTFIASDTYRKMINCSTSVLARWAPSTNLLIKNPALGAGWKFLNILTSQFLFPISNLPLFPILRTTPTTRLRMVVIWVNKMFIFFRKLRPRKRSRNKSWLALRKLRSLGLARDSGQLAAGFMDPRTGGRKFKSADSPAGKQAFCGDYSPPVTLCHCQYKFLNRLLRRKSDLALYKTYALLA